MLSAPARIFQHASALSCPTQHFAVFFQLIFLFCLAVGNIGGAEAATVAAGLARYNAANSGGTGIAATPDSCATCHAGNPGNASPPHRLASNNPGFILDSYTAGGSVNSMVDYFTVTPADRFALSLYIGQFVAPSFDTTTTTINTKARGTGTPLDVYPFLKTDGTSGVATDLTSSIARSSVTNGTTSVAINPALSTSIEYNVNFTPTSTLAFGTGSYIVAITNPTGTSNSLSVTVNIIGISSSLTQNITPGVAISTYTITTNGTRNTACSIDAGSLPPGLNFNGTNCQITGTPNLAATGTYAITVSLGTTQVGTISDTISFTTTSAIVSAATANVTQGQVYTLASPAYTITVNDPTKLNGANPFSIDPATPLPDGLSVDAASGKIVGTPTLGTLSPVNITVRANTTDAGIVTKTVAFSVAFAGVPVISSPTSVSLTFNQAITPIQIVASNPPISTNGYNATGLPTGLSVDQNTGIISGTPTQPGSFSVTLTATNGAGTGTLVVPFTIPVISGATTFTIALNTATTIDLAAFISGTPTGINIATAPTRGTATVSGTRVTYTPNFNFFGSDSFTYVSFSGGLTSTPGVITINVVGRPDPTRDATVTGLLSAQTDTARRFAGSQIGNFQRHLENLHRRSDTSGNTASGFNANRPAAAFSAPSAPSAARTNIQNNPTASPFADPFANNSAGTRNDNPLLKVADAGVALNAASANSIPFVKDALGFITSRSVNLSSLAAQASDGSGLAPGSVSNIWVEGSVNFGKRDATGSTSALDFSTDGISTGIDFHVSDQLTLGVGLGYARSTTDIGNDGTQNKANAYSLTAYGSYQPSANTFIDGLVGIGTLDFDSKRFVAPVNAFTFGQRSGRQLFSSLAAGYEYRNNGILISPYLRLDYSADRLNQSTENGAGAYALTYFKQNSDALQGAIGLRAQSIHETNFGLVEPRIRIEYRHDFQGDQQSTIAFADLPGTRYNLVNSGNVKDSLVFGLGSDFLFRNGVKVGLDYQLQQNFSNKADQAIRFSISKDLDARNRPATRLSSLAFTEPLDLQIEVGYQFDDNVTRSRDAGSILSDSSYSANLGLPFVFLPSNNTRALLTFSLGGERFRTYDNLNRITGGVQGELQYRPSSEFGSPTFALFAHGFADEFESNLRDGFRYSAGVSWQQPITDRISLFGAISHNQRFAKSAVFDTRDYAGRFNIDYALTPTGTLYLTGEYRRGDSNSSAPSSLENINISTVFNNDDAYPGRNFSVYRFDAKTVLSTLGYNWSIGPRDSLDFAWRRIETTPDARPSFAISPRSYIANQYSIIYLMRF